MQENNLRPLRTATFMSRHAKARDINVAVHFNPETIVKRKP